MNRRQLLTRALTITAAAVAVPELTAGPYWGNEGRTPRDREYGTIVTEAQAAPEDVLPTLAPGQRWVIDEPEELAMGEAWNTFWCTAHLDPQTGAGHWHAVTDAISDARAEGYLRGRIVERSRAESRLALGLPMAGE